MRPEARTPRAVVDPAELRRRIETARREGVALLDEELELGMRAMALPVSDSRGQVKAAISVSTLAARVSLEALRNDFQPVLRRAADDIGRRL